MMATFSEGLLLSEKVGLDPNVLVEVMPQIMNFFFWGQLIAGRIHGAKDEM